MNQNQKNIFSSIDMNKEAPKKLSKLELIKLLLQQDKAEKPESKNTNKKGKMMNEVL